MPILYTLNAAVGSYTDRQGNEKTNWVRVGNIFEGKNGRISVKIDAIPAGGGWDGWLQCFEPSDYKGGKGKRSSVRMEDGDGNGSTATNATQAGRSQEDIPF